MADEPDLPAEPAAAADLPVEEEEPLPTHKDDLVALAIQPPHNVPSYVAWAMTVPELKKMLEA